MSLTRTEPALAVGVSAAPQNQRRQATLIGCSAVLLWATLATCTRLVGDMPPMQLLAVAFSASVMFWLGKWLICGQSIVAQLRLPWRIWLLGVSGFFLNLFLYVLALQGPDEARAQANLINYLWPLEIVLLSALLPGEKLRVQHIVGSLVGLLGVVLLLGSDLMQGIRPEFVWTYVAAFFAGLSWAVYSVLIRRLPSLPTDSVGAFCLGTMILSWLAHYLFESRTVWPEGAVSWLALLAIGFGPISMAYLVWDIGLKRGSIQVLGAMSYLTPLLSTTLLVALGYATGSWLLATACVLIVSGAIVASWRELRGG